MSEQDGALDPAVHAWYAEPGPLSSAGRFRAELETLPEALDALCASLQSLVIHKYWGEAYGVTVGEERRRDATCRTLTAILARIQQIDARPLDEPRTPDARFAGTCRDYALLLASVLRQRGVPARARVGFSRYFEQDRFVDHWVCERWDAARGSWRRSDAQLDALQRERLGIDFDPLELPPDAFWSADRSWRACRRGEADPERFGILELRGLWFVGGNVLRDLAAHRRMELQPWDVWGLMRALGIENGAPPPSPETLARVDAIAEAVAADDTAFDRQRALYALEDVRVPDVVFDASSGRTAAWREA